MFRLFCGLALPRDIRDQLRLLQGGIPGARWTHIDDFHITLSFIGEVDTDTGEEIDHALASIHAAPFDLMLRGAGTFDGRHNASHLWIGVEHNDALHHLKEKIDRTLEARRLPVEKRKYMPHITLARMRHAENEDVVAFIQQHNLFKAEPFSVDEFILYRSHIGKEPPIYEELVSYPLG